MKLYQIVSYSMALFLFSGCGGKRVAQEIQDYSPPALLKTAVKAVNTGIQKEKPVVSVQEQDFQMQRQKLEDLKKHWEQILNAPVQAEVFFTPDETLLATLSASFEDERTAQTLLAEHFPLETLEILVWGRNPMIKSAERNVRAAIETYSQAANLNDILRRYSAFTAANMPGVGNTEDMEAVSKKFPFPGIMSLKGTIVSVEVKIAAEDLEIARRTAVTQARKICRNLLYNHRAVEITQEIIGVLNVLESSASKRYETGRIPLQELARIQIQKERMSEELITLKSERRNIQTGLASLLLLPPDTEFGTPSDRKIQTEIPSVENLIRLAMQRRQELKKTRLMIERMELMIEMAETEVYPGFSQNYSLSEQRAVNQAGTMKMEEPFGVNVPGSMGAGVPKMPFTGLTEAYLRETRQKLNALKAELAGAEADTAMILQDAWVKADQAKRELNLYSTKIAGLSEIKFRSSSKAYESGMMPFSEMSDSLMSLLETRLAAEKRKADLGTALAVLEEITGASGLTSKNIEQ